MTTKKVQKNELTKKNDKNLSHHGEIIKEAIKEAGYKLGEYAELIGVSRPNMSSDLMKEVLTPYKIRKYCKALKIDIKEVFGVPDLAPIENKMIDNKTDKELVIKYIELTDKYNSVVSENVSLYKTVLKLQSQLYENGIKADLKNE